MVVLILQHGTDPKNAEDIIANGFQAGAKGRLGGNCVYFVPSALTSVAASISHHRSSGKGIAIITCTLDVPDSKMIALGTGMDTDGKWQSTHYVAKALHPGWLGQPAFEEIAVANFSQLKILRVDFANGAAFGNINKPITVGVHGTCTMTGNIFGGGASMEVWEPPRFPIISGGFSY